MICGKVQVGLASADEFEGLARDQRVSTSGSWILGTFNLRGLSGKGNGEKQARGISGLKICPVGKCFGALVCKSEGIETHC